MRRLAALIRLRGLLLTTGGGVAAYFAYKYRHRRHELAPFIENTLESTTDWCNTVMEKVLIRDSEPLLPSAKELELPEDLPTIVIDMDQVLLMMEHDRMSGWKPLKRPGAEELFKELAFHYEIVIWSDDRYPFAQEVCARWGLPVGGVLHRGHCYRRRGKFIKDLNRLGRDLSRVIIIDHDPAAVLLHPENAILVPPFTGDVTDNTLPILTDFLKMIALSGKQDVRKIIADYGGGIDGEVLRRWETERKAEAIRTAQRRSLTSKLFGNTSNL